MPPLEKTTPLAVPPDATSSVPPLMADPPELTISPPPEMTVGQPLARRIVIHGEHKALDALQALAVVPHEFEFASFVAAA
jgi:hypothetical protein